VRRGCVWGGGPKKGALTNKFMWRATNLAGSNKQN